MINKNTTHRLMIQVSVKQYNWLKAKSEQLEISISQLVRWLLNKKIKDITDIKKLENNPQETIKSEEETRQEWDSYMKELDNLK